MANPKHRMKPLMTIQKTKRRFGPKIATRPRKTHTSSGIKLEPYPVKEIRLGGNTKTDNNVTDTVKGCAGGCHGCYAALSQGVMFGRIDFDKPVSQILNRALLRYDCMQLIWSQPHIRWVRIGTMGDPSFDWELTADTVEIIAETGLVPVIITKFWKLPSEEILTRMAVSGVKIHWSVIPGYDDHPEVSSRSRRILETLQKFHRMTKHENTFIRLCTFLFDPSTEEGRLLAEAQEYFATTSKKNGWRIIETPWKMEANDPRWPFVDADAYHKAHSYSDWENGESRKQTAGALYFKGDPYREKDSWAIGCVTLCTTCPNQCGTE